MQKPFIIKYNGGPKQVDLRDVRFPAVTKLKEVRNISGFGNVAIHEGTGKFDKSKLTIFTTSANLTIDATREGVHGRIRRLREQEAQLLDEIDAQMAELRQRRDEVLKQAWQKANVVTVKELTEKVPQ